MANDSLVRLGNLPRYGCHLYKGGRQVWGSFVSEFIVRITSEIRMVIYRCCELPEL